MPPLAIALGSAAVGIVGSIASAKSQKKAADKATASAEKAAAQDREMQRWLYERNAAAVDPFAQGGYSALSRINEILGLPPITAPTAAPAIPGTAPTSALSGVNGGNGIAGTVIQRLRQQYGNDPVTLLPRAVNAPASGAAPTPMTPLQRDAAGRVIPPNYVAPPPTAPPLTSSVSFTPPTAGAPIAGPTAGAPIAGPGRAEPLTSGVSYRAMTSALEPYKAFDSRVSYDPLSSQRLKSGMVGTALDPGSFTDYRKGSGYDFRLNEGNKALNQGWAGRGALQSGAAMKAALKFGQDYGSNERQNFLGELNNYVRYNDDFERGERNYGDEFAQRERGQKTAIDQYLDDMGLRDRDFRENRGRYMDTFGQNERQVQNALGMYGDEYARGERGYVDARGDLGRAFAQGERGYFDSRGDASRTHALGERGYVDARGDLGRQLQLAMGQYRDAFGRDERQYQDTRGDIGRAEYRDQLRDYLGLLANQQQVGLGGVSALAGIGSNYATNVSAANNSAASVAANAALAKGNANSGMFNNIAGSIGNALGMINLGGAGGYDPSRYGPTYYI